MFYKLGDIVIKKTGGNKMTISEIIDGEYVCIWFVESRLMESRFKEDDILTIDQYRIIQERDLKINNILNIS